MTGIRLLKLVLLAGFGVAVTLILAGSVRGLQAQNPAPPAQAAGSLNNEDCAACHENVVKAFNLNPHAVLEKSSKFKLKNSCETCHGPGEAHATGDGDKTKIVSFTEAAKK